MSRGANNNGLVYSYRKGSTVGHVSKCNLLNLMQHRNDVGGNCSTAR